MLNILLTNDDGYTAKGINVMKSLLSKYGRVVVVAPKTVMSAKSIAISLGCPVNIEKHNDDLYVVEGTPGDCVTFGLGNLDIKFDLVVSGINHGANLSYDTMYSGTVGACLQALTYRIPAIAVSCDLNFELVEKYFDEVYRHILDNKLLSTDFMLNINFPFGDKVEKIMLTNLYYRSETSYFEKNIDGSYYAKRVLHDEDCPDKESDVYAVHHHFVSITKLARSLEYGRCDL